MARTLNETEVAVETQLESYYNSIKTDLGRHAAVSDPTNSDLYLDDGQAFLTFDITATKKEAGYVNGVLHKYDLLLDGANDPNVVHFGANEKTNNSEVISTAQFLGDANAEGNTLHLLAGNVSDGTQSQGLITDDFTLLYYQGNYSLFDL
jgi:hypothetical protein